MTEEMGPLSEPKSWLSRKAAQIGGYQIVAVAAVANFLLDLTDGDSRLEYDTDKLRLTIHGQSNHPADAFSRSMLLALMCFTAILFDVAVINHIPAPESVVPALLSLSAVLMLGLAAVASIQTLFASSILDLTTKKRDDGLDELAERYLDGEFDERELEERADEVVARE